MSTAMTLNGWSKKIITAAAVSTAVIVLAGYAGISIPSYALASDLKAHIKSSDKRYFATLASEKKRQIRETGDELALYTLDRATRALTPREALHEAQLMNRKAAMVRDLDKLNPR